MVAFATVATANLALYIEGYSLFHTVDLGLMLICSFFVCFPRMIGQDL